VAYDDDLARRVRDYTGGDPAVSERKMFGGIAFMTGGNMFCGVLGEDLMVRTGPDAYEDALARPHARPMEFTGRPMKGMVFVARAGYERWEDLERWVEAGLAYARSLPVKKGGRAR
jgi:TfoX/Sxy family transcriptional regulator of competence genes